jgi:two-component system, response regulator PdtaR
VLIVEDEGLIRMHAADMVRDLGYVAIEAVDADHAISLLEDTPEIAVVFTDIQMPGSLDGLRLASVVRDRWPPVKLLVTSGQVNPAAVDLLPGRTSFRSLTCFVSWRPNLRR